jgi:PAS domain S-box-containing protein
MPFTMPQEHSQAAVRWRLSAILRLVLPSVLTIVLFTGALFAVILPALENAFVDRKREMIRELTQTAWDTLAYYHAQQELGRLTRAQAQEQAIAQLRAMRYGDDNKDYFWINDLGPRIVMHPYRPDLEGEDVSDFTDPHGKRLFAEMVEVAKRQGQGYVDYMWQWKDDPKHIVPKVSFVKEFKPWGWVVGTGIYVEDVAQQVSVITGRLTWVGLAIILIVALLEMFMVSQTLRSEQRRQKAQREVERSRGMLRLVMDNIPQLIFWKDLDGAYLGCNRAFAAHAGLEQPDQVKGLSVDDLPARPAEQETLRLAEEEVMATGQAQLHFIEPQTRPDGTRLWMDTNRIPLKDSAGQVVGVLCTHEDITQRREIDKALQESERRFRTLLENVQVGIAIVQEGNIIYTNPEEERILGPLALPFPLSKLAHGQSSVSSDLQRFFAQLYQPGGKGPEESREGQTLDLDLGLQHPRRRGPEPPVRWVHCRTRRMTYQGREALLVIMLDISKARELEQLVRIQDKMASLGRVAAGIAHEIRNPLSGINMYLSALENKIASGEGPDLETIVAKIQAASSKVEGVIKRVLDFSRPSTPNVSLINLNQVVKNVIDLSSVTLRKGGVSLETSLAQDLPPVHADGQLLEQVLLNLVTNAVQALGDAQGKKKIGLASSMERDRIIIKVADSGPGVPPEMRERIFDPFFTGRRDGFGIGLSLCHRIVSDHGGTLKVSESKWGGAEFHMEIPASVYWGYDSHG